MKLIKIVPLLIFAGFANTVSSQSLNGLTFEGGITHGILMPYQGRELSRTPLVPFDNEENSLTGVINNSSYVQPLSEWKVSTSADGVRATTNFKVPFAWDGREHFLHIESAPSEYRILVNGNDVGFNRSPGTPSEFDLTRYSTEGINSLEIFFPEDSPSLPISDNRVTSFPTSEVYIISQPKVRIRDIVSEVNFENQSATLQLGIIVKSHLLNEREVRIHYKLLDPAGEEISGTYKDVRTGRKEEDTVRFFVNIPQARPWSHETPDLYRLLLRTQYEGRFTEYLSYEIGLTRVDFTDGELHINKYPLQLNIAEYEYHHDREKTVTDLKALKEQGYNCILLKNAPSQKGIFTICDNLGLYVINIADINIKQEVSATADNPVLVDIFRDRVLSSYHTSANHPSVIMFNMGHSVKNGYNLQEAYITLKNTGLQRPVIFPDAGAEWNTDAITGSVYSQNPNNKGERIILTSSNTNSLESIDPQLIFPNADKVTECRVINNSRITPLNGKIVYTIRQGMKKISEGSIPLYIEPGSSMDFTLPTENAKTGKTLKVEARLQTNLN